MAIETGGKSAVSLALWTIDLQSQAILTLSGLPPSPELVPSGPTPLVLWSDKTAVEHSQLREEVNQHRDARLGSGSGSTGWPRLLVRALGGPILTRWMSVAVAKPPLLLRGGGLVTSQSLSIGAYGGRDGFINMATGGMLALFGDADESIGQFLRGIYNSNSIRFWDSSLEVGLLLPQQPTAITR